MKSISCFKKIFITLILVIFFTILNLILYNQIAYAENHQKFNEIFGSLNSEEHSANELADNPNSLTSTLYNVNLQNNNKSTSNSIANGYYKIRMSSSLNYYIEISNASYDRGARVQLCLGNSSDTQLWQVKNQTNGSILLINANCGLVMDIANGIIANGTIIQSFYTNHSSAQNWTPVLCADGTYMLKPSINSSFSLDLPDGRAETGNGLQLWSTTECFNQKWIFEPASTPQLEIPSLNLSLNGYTLDQINSGSKETKYKGNNLTIREQNGTTITQTDFSNVQINGRGNSTWSAPKKPYNIKLDTKFDLFGLGKAKNWVLLANYYDTSLERNELSFDIAKNLGLESAFGGKQINLYIDNEYVGMYFLTHKVEINNSVCPCDNDGIVVECDGWTPDDIYFKSKVYRNQIVLKDVKDDTQAQYLLNNFKDKWNAFEVALESNDWDTVTQLIDLESFTKYVMLCEFNQNWESFGNSTFFYMKSVNSKIYAGPAWDYDNAWANTEIYGKRDLDSSISLLMAKYDYCANYAAGLLNFDHFRTLLEQCYANYLNNQGSVYSALLNKHYLSSISSSNKNNNRWELKNVAESINRLNSYTTSRCSFLDKYYTPHVKILEGKYTLKSDTGYIIDPIVVKSNIDGTYTFQHISAGSISVANDTWTQNQNLTWKIDTPNINNKWYVKYQDEKYLFQSKLNGFGIHVNKILQQSALSDVANQKWNLIKRD